MPKEFNTHVDILVYYQVLKGQMMSLILIGPKGPLNPFNQSFHYLKVV